MPRDAIGELRWVGQWWEARVTFRGRERLGLAMPFSESQAVEARDRCAIVARLAQRLRKAGLFEEAPKLLEMAASATTPAKLDATVRGIETLCTPGATELDRKSAVPTFKEFGEDWTKGKLHRKWPDYVKEKRSAEDDRVRLEKHVYPIVENVALNRFEIRHAEAVMTSLPSTLSASTRRQIAQLIHRLLAMAVYPGRYIAANPLPRGFLPKPSKQKAWPILYPKEDAALLGHTPIPIGRRLFYGWLHREGCRMSEASSLRWCDLDLKHGTVRLDANKTDEPRTWVLDAGVRRALERYKKLYRADAKPVELVFIEENGGLIQTEHMADRIRDDLEAAKVVEERPELVERTATRGRFGTHGFRRSFVTLALANGKTETWVTDRTGHESSVMLARYRQAARNVAELHLGQLVPLDIAIPELYEGSSSSGNSPRIPHASLAPVAQLDRASDFEAEQASGDSRIIEKLASKRPEMAPVETRLGQSEGHWGNQRGLVDAVDQALAVALERASAAGEWSTVTQLARELEARRLGRVDVVQLEVERARRKP